DSCTLSLTAKQWRKGGSGHPNTYPFGYACGPFLSPRLSGLTPFPSLDLHSVISSVGATALNGNLPANQYFIQQSIGSLHWKPGEQLLLRWDDRDEPGNDDALSIDQFSFTASGIVPTDIIIPEIKAVTIPD
ncbi:hypothetical protein, partial [Morganella morganii]|uniref:hypothetical protein n=1 Tax=Morganella morganii TaxID=582 RepID=UPI00222E9431